jgi:hypothetical protein
MKRNSTEMLLHLGVFAAMLLSSSGEACASSILYSIGGNEFGAPVRVSKLDTAAGTSTAQFDMQTDSAGFSGLTYRSSDQNLYSVMLDGSGNSTLVSFSATGVGVFSSVMMLQDLMNPDSISFNGGLVYDANDQYFYSVANDPTGQSALYRIDAAAKTAQRLTTRLPLSLNGGLTVLADGTLGSIQNDAYGNSFVYAFTLGATSASINPLFAGSIGQGFYGGLSYSDGTLYAIGSDPFAAGTLFSIDGMGAKIGVLAAGDGFLNAGLTEVPDATPVPEPSTLLLVLSGGISMTVAKITLKRKQNAHSA